MRSASTLLDLPVCKILPTLVRHKLGAWSYSIRIGRKLLCVFGAAETRKGRRNSDGGITGRRRVLRLCVRRKCNGKQNWKREEEQ